jgi:tRNA nucleotidyltransferase (CCA-adding enzyme)
LLERCDALRKPDRFVEVLQACEADARGRGGDFATAPYPQRDRLMAALSAARGIDAGAVARQYADNPVKIRDAVQAARIDAVKAAGLGGEGD